MDFEKELVQTAVNHMIRDHIDYSDFFASRLGLNIRLVNLLTAVRLYVDQMSQNVQECVPKLKDIEIKVREFFSTEYDNNKEYRFMEALRNHVQHRGLPVHFTSYGGQWTSLDGNGFLEYYVELSSERSYFEESKKFKKTVLDELDEKTDLKASTRCYIESISNIHHKIRGLISENVTNSRKVIEEAHNKYRAVYDESLVGLSISSWQDDKLFSLIPILLDWDDIRIKLQDRNVRLLNLRKRHITSKINNTFANYWLGTGGETG